MLLLGGCGLLFCSTIVYASTALPPTLRITTRTKPTVAPTATFIPRCVPSSFLGSALLPCELLGLVPLLLFIGSPALNPTAVAVAVATVTAIASTTGIAISILCSFLGFALLPSKLFGLVPVFFSLQDARLLRRLGLFELALSFHLLPHALLLVLALRM